MSIQSDTEKGAGLLSSPRWANHNTFSVDEAAEIVRVSRWSRYEAIKRGEVAVIRLGNRIRIGRRTLVSMVGE